MEKYHYTESGLKNVYLENGFIITPIPAIYSSNQ